MVKYFIKKSMKMTVETDDVPKKTWILGRNYGRMTQYMSGLTVDKCVFH